MPIETQETINAWQDRTFLEATPVGVTFHLMEELDELREKLEWMVARDRNPSPEEINDIGFECADVIILIYAWAKKHGILNVHERWVGPKMKINRAREWNIQEDGTGRHK